MTETRMRDLGISSHLDALLATVGAVEGLRVIDIGCGEGQMARAKVSSETACCVVSSVMKSYTTASSGGMFDGRLPAFNSATMSGDSPALTARGACANHSTCERHCRPMIKIANSLSFSGTDVSHRK